MAQVFNEDARRLADLLEPESVQCVVTSPPYWGLRDYGLEPSVWGGDPECNHEWGEVGHRRQRGLAQGSTSTLDGRKRVEGEDSQTGLNTGAFCSRCGAWRGCLGLEPTPEQFVANIVEVFRAVWKVLRPDGTLWLNLGDSYWGAGGANNNSGITGRRPEEGADKDERDNPVAYRARWGRHGALKPKDLCGIPWRVAFALQEDGWYLRSDIIWSKPNPMPESVTDRPTKAHEYLFLLTKSPHYYYDYEAIAEPSVTKDPRKTTFNRTSGKMPALNIPGQTMSSHREGRSDTPPRETRNRRSVWTVPTSRFPEAHFATFPEALVEPCILAGSKPGDMVLDPFAGSGTTLAVAERLQRQAVGFELNPEYIALIEGRLNGNQIKFMF